ncbi:MAG: elongation factor T, partial [Halothiobacillaceae bacterium]
MTISAALVKELRERTGSGMMECKKALVETAGDIEAAIELMRKTGLAKADKKAGRIAAEGIIEMSVAADGARGVMVEINSETDFVAKSEDFLGFTKQVAQAVIAGSPADVEALLALPGQASGAESVNQSRQHLIAKIGENIAVRRFADFTAASGGVVAGYLHGNRIGVLVELKGGDAVLARDVAMHVA